MKIIDLLNKIANEEEVPKKIKIDNRFSYEYEKDIDYKAKDGTYLFDSYIQINKEDMNKEVEIIEEKKIPEKLIPTSLKGIDNLDEKIEIAHIDTVSVIETVNEIIDYLKSKGE